MSNTDTPSHNAPLVYLSHVDEHLGNHLGSSLSPYTHEQLKALLITYALFYDRIVVGDSRLLTNRALFDVFFSPTYANAELDQLLVTGLVTPAIRDNAAGSFSQLEHILAGRQTINYMNRADSIRFASLLDTRASDNLVYHGATVYTEFTDLMTAVLSDESLSDQLGIGAISPDALGYADVQRSSDEGLFRRSSFYEFARTIEAGDPAAAASLRNLATTVSHAALTSYLGVHPSYPHQLQASVSVLHGIDIFVPAIQQIPNESSPEQIAVETFPLDLTRLHLLDYQTIHDIRASKYFKDYLTRFQNALSMSDPVEQRYLYISALKDYLGHLEEPLAHALTGKSRAIGQVQTQLRWSEAGTVAAGAICTLSGLVSSLSLMVSVPIGLGVGFAGYGYSRMLSRRQSSMEEDSLVEARRRFSNPRLSWPEQKHLDQSHPLINITRI